MTTWWPAPTADGPLNATVTIPGSKSLSNRYLILAVLGAKPVTLVGLLRSRDTELMMGALSALGVRCDIDPENDTTVTVTPPESGRFSGNVGVYLRARRHGDAFRAGAGAVRGRPGAVRWRRSGIREADAAGSRRARTAWRPRRIPRRARPAAVHHHATAS